jgi:hypothetical protein
VLYVIFPLMTVAGTLTVVLLISPVDVKKFGLPMQTGLVVLDGTFAKSGSLDSLCRDTIAIGRLYPSTREIS